MFETVRGSWRLITHKANPKQRVYFSQEIQVNEPVDPTCSLNWAIDGLNITCTYPRLIHSLKMSVCFGPSSSKYLFLNHTRHGNLCHLLVPKKDLPFGSNSLVIYLFIRLRNSSATLSYEIEHSFVLENPQVNKIACSTSNNTPGRIVCTCARTDSSDVTSEFTWRVNNLIQHSQPGLDISQGSHNSVFTLDLSLSFGLQEISCQVSNVFGWKSGVEVYTLDEKVLLATTIRELEPMSENNITSEHLTARERKAASKWRRTVFGVSLCAVVVLFFVIVVVFSCNKVTTYKCVSKSFCRRGVNTS
ncbi:uncharacterized protein LOC131928514 [Physella acuta]|uniref:uncharacterized protein LOC131928514 n=1 Tax=Physella acuta TaxID=109671 RepID=UPI0027DAB701|nr:uncharacterized protein LOC131928514 [Physella acuta]